jgi:hypothetical protein
MMKKLTLIFTVGIMVFASCKKDLKDPGGTAAEKVANEWWVTFTDTTGEDLYGLGHIRIATYNTSANNNEMWVDDLGNTYVFKVKSTVDYSNLTFSAKDAANEYFDPADSAAAPLTVTISNGKVLTGLGHTKSGGIVDSIYMQATVSGDPTTYVLSGHGRTGFFEDEY